MSTPRRDVPRRPLKGPGFVFTAIALAATLTLGVVALDASQSSPPAVAEFAPAALNQVKNAPHQLGSLDNPPGTPTFYINGVHAAGVGLWEQLEPLLIRAGARR